MKERGGKVEVKTENRIMRLGDGEYEREREREMERKVEGERESGNGGLLVSSMMIQRLNL